MLEEWIKKKLEKQQYRVIGNHSAVKICGWTKNMIRGKGGCYKLKFYGIISSQCMQMTTSLSCANRCKFCWRDYKDPVSKEWKGFIDEPSFIFEESLKQHHKLLTGFGGLKNPNKIQYLKSKEVKHVALSLTGEPIFYPKINEIVEIFHKNKISTFLVTNAQYPDQIKNLKLVTQLYLSIDAPNKTLLKKIDLPIFDDYWERMNKSLEYLSQKKYRKCIRLTAVKDFNMENPLSYAKLIKKGNPDFVEIKSYMHVGASRKRLKRENMPSHKEVLDFSYSILKHLPDYDFCSEFEPSRVVLLAKKSLKINGEWYTWIDFDKFFNLIKKNLDVKTEDYIKKSPF